MKTVLEQVVEKYNYDYNYFEGYSYNHPQLPSIHTGGYVNGNFSLLMEGKFIEIKSLEQFENIIKNELDTATV
jgi:hypothetical protein